MQQNKIKSQRTWKKWYTQNSCKNSFEVEDLVLPLIFENYFKMQNSWEGSL